VGTVGYTSRDPWDLKLGRGCLGLIRPKQNKTKKTKTKNKKKTNKTHTHKHTKNKM
jgi:hypothetical protein